MTNTSNIIPKEEIDRRRAEAIDAASKKAVSYDKYKIQKAAEKRELWDTMKTAIANLGYADSWSNLGAIPSDNAEFLAALPQIRAMLQPYGLDVDKILAEECVADKQSES